MSTFLYGAMQRKRKDATPGKSKSDQPPGVNTYLDALAALVPAEMLALHAFLLGLFTKTSESGEGTVTVITDQPALWWTFWGLTLGCAVFFFAGEGLKGFDEWDILRMFIPVFAFVGWTMAQKEPTAFDAVFPNVMEDRRYAIAAVIAVVLGLIASRLGGEKADQKET